MHWWCGLGEASGGEGAETNLTEGPQETAPVGAEGQFDLRNDMLGLGILGRRILPAPEAVSVTTKGLV